MNTIFGKEYVNSWISAEKLYRNFFSRITGALHAGR